MGWPLFLARILAGGAVGAGGGAGLVGLANRVGHLPDNRLQRNKYLTNADMEEIFISRFLNNLALTDKEKKFIMSNTFAKVQVIDSVRGIDIFCTGKIAEDLI